MNIPNNERAQKQKLPIINRIGKFFAISSIVVLACSASCAIQSRTITTDMKQPISGDPPPGFPILVFWFENGSNQMQARAIPIEELPTFRKEHPKLFFTLPDGRGQELHQSLRNQADGIDGDIAKQYSTGRRMQIVARIESSNQSEQHWKVRFQHGNDHVNIGYYRATKDTFTPTHIERFFGPALALQSLPRVLVGWLIVWVVATFGIILLCRFTYFNASKWWANAT